MEIGEEILEKLKADNPDVTGIVVLSNIGHVKCECLIHGEWSINEIVQSAQSMVNNVMQRVAMEKFR